MNTNSVEYKRIHYWIKKQLGKPKKCDRCGSTKKNKYGWSNNSKKYLYDIKDWERLCSSCHYKKDFPQTHCKRGHEFTKENTYIYRNRRTCRTCANMHSCARARRKEGKVIWLNNPFKEEDLYVRGKYYKATGARVGRYIIPPHSL